MVQQGDRVKILYPEYAAGETGLVLQQEMLQDKSKTEYWLVQIDGQGMILALLPKEMHVLQKANAHEETLYDYSDWALGSPSPDS